MLSYPGLYQLLTGSGVVDFGNRIMPILVRSWLENYDRVTLKNEIVTVRTHGFSYPFDIANERLVAAWGVSQGKSASHPRYFADAGTPAERWPAVPSRPRDPA
jgi:hypothetical protein